MPLLPASHVAPPSVVTTGIPPLDIATHDLASAQVMSVKDWSMGGTSRVQVGPSSVLKIQPPSETMVHTVSEGQEMDVACDQAWLPGIDGRARAVQVFPPSIVM